MKYARYIIWNAVILISILFSSPKVFGQTDLELKQYLINGVSSFEENMNEDAANSFSNGSTLENYEDIAAYNLGRSLMETEDLEGAASAFKQAIASSENNELISNAWYNSGNIALNSDDPSTAVEAYKSSLRLNPDFANARHNLTIANKMLQQHALRTAINAPMQGSSADIIKKAMLDIQSWIDRENNGVKMIMQVHDELVFELRADKAKEYGEIVRSMMSDTLKLSIPLEVDVGIGTNWQEAH